MANALNIAPRNPMNISPTEKSVLNGVRDVEAVAEGLATALSETYALLLKTHAYHWNVEGPLFHAVHTMTEEHYNNLFAATDTLAERIRAIGRIAPMKPADIVDMSADDEMMERPSAISMVQDLARDHERLAHRLHKLIQLAEAREDAVTADLATTRAAFHQKAVWMLRALSAT